MSIAISLIEAPFRIKKDTFFFSNSSISNPSSIDLDSSTFYTENSASYLIGKIIFEKSPLIHQRNLILESWFKAYIPFYRKKLKEIDAKLDALDWELYLLETQNNIKKEDLEELELAAKEAVMKYNKYL